MEKPILEAGVEASEIEGVVLIVLRRYQEAECPAQILSSAK